MAVTLLKHYERFAGLSTDVKPANAPMGSTFFEWDTSKLFTLSPAGWVEKKGTIHGDVQLSGSNVEQTNGAVAALKSNLAAGITPTGKQKPLATDEEGKLQVGGITVDTLTATTVSIQAKDPLTGDPVELTAVQDQDTGNWYLQTVDAAPFAYDEVTQRFNVSLPTKIVETITLVSSTAISDTTIKEVLIPFSTLNKYRDFDIMLVNTLDKSVYIYFTASPSNHIMRWVLGDGTVVSGADATGMIRVPPQARGVPLSVFKPTADVYDRTQWKKYLATFGLATDTHIKFTYNCAEIPTTGVFSAVLYGIPI